MTIDIDNWKPWQEVMLSRSFENIPAGIKGRISGDYTNYRNGLVGLYIDTYDTEDFTGCTIGPIPLNYLEIC